MDEFAGRVWRVQALVTPLAVVGVLLQDQGEHWRADIWRPTAGACIMCRMKNLLIAFVAAASLGACTRPNETLELEFYPSPRANAVFSPAVRVGNLLFLSGQIGTDSSNRLVAGGLQAEARQALNNIKTTLEKYGSSMDRVAKCTVFLADFQKDYSDFNEIYVTYFRARKPARSAFGATNLALGARLEIECIAVVS